MEDGSITKWQYAFYIPALANLGPRFGFTVRGRSELRQRTASAHHFRNIECAPKIPGRDGAIRPPLFTDAAAHTARKLTEQEGNAALKLRVYVQGGGCSGFQHGFTSDEEVQEGDTEIANVGVTLLVDPMSVQYLMGAEIDYREDLSGAQFIIRNPNAATTCGCGSSFSV